MQVDVSPLSSMRVRSPHWRPWAIALVALATSAPALAQDKPATPRAAAPPASAASAVPTEFDGLRAAYSELLVSAYQSQAPLSPAASALLADPSRLLALLEQRFQAAPSIESLAWYGSVAEDVAYVGVQRRVDPK